MKVVIGNREESITGLVVDLLGVCAGNRGIRMDSLRLMRSDEILEAARRGAADFFILVMNNIFYMTDSRPVYDPAGGVELVRRLRAVSRAPVIAMSGFPVDPGYDDEIRGAGADFFFRLPFDPGAFMRAVDRVIARLHQGLDDEVPECVQYALENWETLAFTAYEWYLKHGRIAVMIEPDGDEQTGARLSGIIYDRTAGGLAPETAGMLDAYNPDREIVIQFVDTRGRLRTRRLGTSPTGRHPKRVWFFEMLRRIDEEPETVDHGDLPDWFVASLEQLHAMKKKGAG